MTKIAGSGSISQMHGSADRDPDPPQNVMDPQHWYCTVHPESQLEKNAGSGSVSGSALNQWGSATLCGGGGGGGGK
jgi:hypothetical protein